MFAAVLALQVSLPVFAEGKGDPAKKQEQRLEKMTKDLNLTPDQKEKVGAILKEQGEKNKADMQKCQDTMKANRDSLDQNIKSVLTPEQVTKFEKMQADRKAKMDKKMKDKDCKCGECAPEGK